MFTACLSGPFCQMFQQESMGKPWKVPDLLRLGRPGFGNADFFEEILRRMAPFAEALRIPQQRIRKVCSWLTSIRKHHQTSALCNQEISRLVCSKISLFQDFQIIRRAPSPRLTCYIRRSDVWHVSSKCFKASPSHCNCIPMA